MKTQGACEQGSELIDTIDMIKADADFVHGHELVLVLKNVTFNLTGSVEVVLALFQITVKELINRVIVGFKHWW